MRTRKGATREYNLKLNYISLPLWDQSTSLTCFVINIMLKKNILYNCGYDKAENERHNCVIYDPYKILFLLFYFNNLISLPTMHVPDSPLLIPFVELNIYFLLKGIRTENL